MKRKISKLGALERRLLVLCLLLIGGSLAFVFNMPSQLSAMDEQRKYDSDIYEFVELFSDIYGQIRSRYVDEVPSKQLLEGAINGMFATLDPHSSWLPPDDQESLARDTEGEYSGVGLNISLDKNRILTVISPMPGSPAARAGMLPWDRVIEIDGQKTENITLLEAVKKLTGPNGTAVKLKVARQGEAELLEFSLVREQIKVVSVFSKVLDGNIGYLRIAKFQDDTAHAVRKALEEFNEKRVNGIVVDVRNNVGGLLDRAVEICNFFLPKKQLIVSIKGRSKGNDRDYYAIEDQLAKQPLVVLINHGSASASEIFAGAMKDTKRGVIVGPKDARSYGKGSVQTISMLKRSLEKDANGDYRPSGLRLTTARYYTPSGVSIDHKGIDPDIAVEIPRYHERLLAMHGLLGEPNTIEPSKLKELEREFEKLSANPLLSGKEEEGEDPASVIAPVEDGQTTATTSPIKVIPLDKEESAVNNISSAAGDDFRDIVLDEAIQYLKENMLLVATRQAA